MEADTSPDALPGEDLIERGICDLCHGRESIEALLVAVGAPRLRRLGVDLPEKDMLPAQPEHRLYDLLARADARTAHSAYNALIRRLVSRERVMELMRARAAAGQSPAPCG